MCHTPLLLLGQLKPFFNNLTMKYTPKIRGRHVQLMISELVLARLRRLVAFRFYESPVPPPLGDARVIVPAHSDGHRNGQQVGVFFIEGLLIVALAATKAIRSE